jgi:hypothetical protein
MTSSCCSCHHAAGTWPRWPPGPSNEAYLSSPHLEASPATTFHACSSPAPTPVKLQPAPAILSQELVHTTLSITHHTRKRPSTGPRTTHGPQSSRSRFWFCQIFLLVCSPWSEECSSEILVHFGAVCREFLGGDSCWVQDVRPSLVADLTALGVLVFTKIFW